MSRNDARGAPPSWPAGGDRPATGRGARSAGQRRGRVTPWRRSPGDQHAALDLTILNASRVRTALAIAAHRRIRRRSRSVLEEATARRCRIGRGDPHEPVLTTRYETFCLRRISAISLTVRPRYSETMSVELRPSCSRNSATSRRLASVGMVPSVLRARSRRAAVGFRRSRRAPLRRSPVTGSPTSSSSTRAHSASGSPAGPSTMVRRSWRTTATSTRARSRSRARRSSRSR